MTPTGDHTTIGAIRRRLADEVRRIAFQRSLSNRACAHQVTSAAAMPDEATCSGCAQQGETWVKLRMCLTCGAVGCCDSTPGMHARAHYEATGHPLMRSIEPGESWAWCYPDQAYVGSAAAART